VLANPWLIWRKVVVLTLSFDDRRDKGAGCGEMM
jgi:hypothetical protein